MRPVPHSMRPPLSAGGVEPTPKFSKSGSLTESQFLKGGCWERGGDLFQVGIAVFI